MLMETPRDLKLMGLRTYATLISSYICSKLRMITKALHINFHIMPAGDEFMLMHLVSLDNWFSVHGESS
jgi:hypothetical protein